VPPARAPFPRTCACDRDETLTTDDRKNQHHGDRPPACPRLPNREVVILQGKSTVVPTMVLEQGAAGGGGRSGGWEEGRVGRWEDGRVGGWKVGRPVGR
jgi:hypothetical protein